jgi:hypothetical protein
MELYPGSPVPEEVRQGPPEQGAQRYKNYWNSGLYTIILKITRI